MALRQILKDGDPSLRKVSRPVTKFNDRLMMLLDDMQQTLAESGGVGLAAPQVGVLRRVVLVDTGEQGIIEMINPVITHREGEQEDLEGCLSIPGKYGIVRRPQKVRATYLDRDGNECEIEAEDFVARIVCHETDHLEGTLYIDVAERMLTDEEMQELEQKRGES
ncbi:MAG: peptide deformylase [Ruminococcaceae bacterium]|nr:peptide deformylase [Oscillospiraceae bacterium]